MLSDLVLFVEIAFWLSAGLLFASAGLFVATLCAQRAVEASARRRARIFATWHDVLEGSGDRIRPRAPDPRDAFALLCAWCDLAQDETSTAARDRLRRVAYDFELDRVASRFLRGHDSSAKIAGARALGYLGEKGEGAALAALTSASDRELALAARTSLHALTSLGGGD